MEKSKILTPRPEVYGTGHILADTVGAAFARGIQSDLRHVSEWRGGDSAFYGILRGTGEILRRCAREGYNYWYIDHGYFKRGHFGGYYRITKNGFQVAPGASEGTRFRKLNLAVQPWKRGNHIVAVPPSDVMGAFRGVSDWLPKTLNVLGSVTDRPVYVSTKKSGDFKELLQSAHCVVTDHSNCAVDAILAGVPVITTGWETPLWTFDDIESPYYPEREPWLHWLADNQFTLEEMQEGIAWNHLESISGGISETSTPLRFVLSR